MPSARVSDGHLPIVKDQSRVIDRRLGVGVELRCTVCHRRHSRIRTHAADLPCMASNPSADDDQTSTARGNDFTHGC